MDKNEKTQSSVPDKLSVLSDDEAIKEIDFGTFLENGDNRALLEGLHADIDKAQQDLNSEFESLYDDIMSQGPQTVAPRPMSVIVSSGNDEKPQSSALDDMWVSPEEYIEMKQPAVSTPSQQSSQSEENDSDEKQSLFSLIDDLKSDAMNTGMFDEILKEIENGIGSSPVSTDISEASKLVSEETVARMEKAKEEQLIKQQQEEEAFNDKINIYLTGEYNPETGFVGTGSDFDIPFENLPSAQDSHQNAASTFSEAVASQDALYEKSKIEFEDISSGSDVGEKSGADENKGKKRLEKKKGKTTAKEILRRIVLSISIIVIIVSSGVLLEQYVYEPWKFKKQQAQLEDIVKTSTQSEDPSAVVDSNTGSQNADVDLPEGMLAKYAKLYAVNEDLAGWISVPGFDINLPIAQGNNNDYYLHRDIYGKWTMYGVPFFDYRMKDLKNLHVNNVVYGHNMRHDDLIFGLFENYREIGGFEQAPVIECNTIYGDHTWFVYAVFITNSDPADDNGYSFPYNFIDCSPTKFDSYIKEIDKRKLYTTGVDITPNDKILTLSTCCYDFNEARLVVVAREKRDGESVNIDTSKAYYNTNPKYPQAWYNANNKSNPYANDPRW
ncbi:MAG: class B sortase [Clostridiales bacterium]|nr:class B sortase [Clostridiales bacterium]